jgi:hypothetical protein
MQVDYSANYSVKEIRSTSDPHYAIAISLYAMYTPPALRTDTNEIGHWLNHYNKSFDDRFHALAFFVNGSVAGYCQLVHLREPSMIVIDYITIDERYRGGYNVFFEFAEHVKAFVRKNYPDHRYIAVEIAPLHDDAETRYGFALMRLLKMIGFGVADAPYVQPQLGYLNVETELQGAMLLFPKPIGGSLPRDTYLKIVHAIYYQHYVRWYGVHGEDYQLKYKDTVDRLYKKLSGEVKKQPVIVNGIKHLPEGVSPVVVKETLPSKDLIYPVLLILFWLAGVFVLKSVFKESNALTVVCLLLVTTLYLALVSVTDKRAAATMKELLKTFKSIFGKVR